MMSLKSRLTCDSSSSSGSVVVDQHTMPCDVLVFVNNRKVVVERAPLLFGPTACHSSMRRLASYMPASLQFYCSCLIIIAAATAATAAANPHIITSLNQPSPCCAGLPASWQQQAAGSVAAHHHHNISS
jgi:hypothetical protein